MFPILFINRLSLQGNFIFHGASASNLSSSQRQPFHELDDMSTTFMGALSSWATNILVSVTSENMYSYCKQNTSILLSVREQNCFHVYHHRRDSLLAVPGQDTLNIHVHDAPDRPASGHGTLATRVRFESCGCSQLGRLDPQPTLLCPPSNTRDVQILGAKNVPTNHVFSRQEVCCPIIHSRSTQKLNNNNLKQANKQTHTHTKRNVRYDTIRHDTTRCDTIRDETRRDKTRQDKTRHDKHYTTLHYTTLHYTALHYTTPHHTTPHHTTPHHTTPHPTTPHPTTPHPTPPHHTTLHPTPPHPTTPHDTTLHYTTLHYTTLHYTTLHYNTIQYKYKYNTIQYNTIQYIGCFLREGELETCLRAVII